MDKFLEAAIEEAKIGLEEGGIPIGSVLVIDNKIVGRGHNRRVQNGSAILHAEMDCLENAECIFLDNGNVEDCSYIQEYQEEKPDKINVYDEV